MNRMLRASIIAVLGAVSACAWPSVPLDSGRGAERVYFYLLNNNCYIKLQNLSANSGFDVRLHARRSTPSMEVYIEGLSLPSSLLLYNPQTDKRVLHKTIKYGTKTEDEEYLCLETDPETGEVQVWCEREILVPDYSTGEFNLIWREIEQIEAALAESQPGRMLEFRIGRARFPFWYPSEAIDFFKEPEVFCARYRTRLSL